MSNFQFEFNERQMPLNKTQVGIIAQDELTAAWLVDIFLCNNEVDNIDFKSIKLYEVGKN